MATLKILLITVSICLCLVQIDGFFEFMSPKPYSKISKYLADRVNDENDLEANLAAAKRWYDSKGSNTITGFNGSLRNFTRLAECLQEDSCNRKALEIFQPNMHEYFIAKNFARAHNILNLVIKKHLHLCRPTYLRRFEELRQSFDEDAWKRLELLIPLQYYKDYVNFMAIGINEDFPFERLVAHSSIGRMRVIGNKKPAIAYVLDIVRAAVESMPTELSNGRMNVNRRRKLQCIEMIDDSELEECKTHLLELYQSSVSGICKDFTEVFGPDVFEPHKLALSRTPDDMDKTGTYLEPNEYQLAWFRYILCSPNVSERSEIDLMMKYIRREDLFSSIPSQ